MKSMFAVLDDRHDVRGCSTILSGADLIARKNGAAAITMMHAYMRISVLVVRRQIVGLRERMPRMP